MAATSGPEDLQPKAMSDASLSEKFFRYFQREAADIGNKIEKLSSRSTSGGERADAVEHCLASIARLSDEAKDAGAYLPAHDQRTYGEAVKALSARLQEARASFAPRARFAFKSGGPVFTAKKNESAISLDDAAALAARHRRPGYTSDRSNESSFATTPVYPGSPAPEEVAAGEGGSGDGDRGFDGIDAPADPPRFRQPSFSQSKAISISNHEGMHIVLPASARHAATTGSLRNLHRCVVDMSAPTRPAGEGEDERSAAAASAAAAFAALTVRGVSESLIVCGRVAGAAHLTQISSAVIVVAARQFRLHAARHCTVYLLCPSRPILEDCVDVRFAPLPDAYLGPTDGRTEIRWRDVDDFNWLRSEPSPNWSVLEPGERVSDEVWRDVVPGGPGIGTEDVLKAVRLPQ